MENKIGLDNVYLGSHKSPDYMDKIWVWRAWNFTNNSLRSTYQSVPWQKFMTAMCVNNSEHKAPVHNCSCGLYGYFDFHSALQMNTTVIGLCKVWGHAEIHEKGIRSEKSEIVALAMVPKQRLKHQLNTKFHFSYQIFLQEFYAEKPFYQKLSYQRAKNRIFHTENSDIFQYEKILQAQEAKGKYVSEKLVQKLDDAFKAYDCCRRLDDFSKEQLENWTQKNNIIFCADLIKLQKLAK